MQIHRLHLEISFIVLSVKGLNQLEYPSMVNYRYMQ